MSDVVTVLIDPSLLDAGIGDHLCQIDSGEVEHVSLEFYDADADGVYRQCRIGTSQKVGTPRDDPE